MKKALSLILVLFLFCAVPVYAAADGDIQTSLSVTPPAKVYYQVGDAIDYTGGLATYKAQTAFFYTLSANNCAGFDSATPGNKTVTVSINGLKAYFRVVVFSKEEPITGMTDINYTHWAYSLLGPCMKAGYFEGNGNGTVTPDAALTRAQMAKLLYEAYKTDPTVMTTQFNIAPAFSDVPADQWYYTAVEACRKAGLVEGMGEGKFEPNAPILRQDAVLMIMRIRYTAEQLAALDVAATVNASGLQPGDFDQVADYAKPAMAVALGTVVRGNENGLLTPQKSITRGETASVFKFLFLKDYNWVAPVLKTPPVIYLSPSRQTANSYTGVATNEGAQMYRVGEACKAILEQQGYTVVMAPVSEELDTRTAEANAMGADVYVAIHSNAGGNVTGTTCYYNGNNWGAKALSDLVYGNVAALTPTADHGNHNDMLANIPFKEISLPHMANLLIETEYHDKPATAQWIVNNTDQLGRAIAEGIIAYCNQYLPDRV